MITWHVGPPKPGRQRCCANSIAPSSSWWINLAWPAPIEHRGHSLRVLTHGDYREFYREQGDDIDLLRVIDGRRNIPDVLDELDGLM